MGTWGISIFSDDIAQDVREEWIDVFKIYASAKDATAAIREDMRDEFADTDDGPIVILALALTLWKYGCLDEKTKLQALQVIDEKKGLDRWREEGPKLEAARLAEYAKVRTTLCSEQPPSKDGTRKPLKFEDSGLRPGDIFSIPLKSPNAGRGYFRVVRVGTDRKACRPVVQLLKVPLDVDPISVDWKKVDAIGLRNIGNSHAFNTRFLATGLWDWNARKWDRKSVVIHAKVPLGSEEQEMVAKPYATSMAWIHLADYVIHSLDESHWPETIDAYHMFRSMSELEILDCQRYLELARYRLGYAAIVCVGPALSLIYRDGDYARAEKIMQLLLAFDRTYEAHVVHGHALFGLGKVHEAEEHWHKALSKENCPTEAAVSYRKREIEMARAEVLDRRAGKPHKIPPNLAI